MRRRLRPSIHTYIHTYTCIRVCYIERWLTGTAVSTVAAARSKTSESAAAERPASSSRRRGNDATDIYLYNTTRSRYIYVSSLSLSWWWRLVVSLVSALCGLRRREHTESAPRLARYDFVCSEERETWQRRTRQRFTSNIWQRRRGDVPCYDSQQQQRGRTFSSSLSLPLVRSCTRSLPLSLSLYIYIYISIYSSRSPVESCQLRALVSFSALLFVASALRALVLLAYFTSGKTCRSGERERER